jgi:HEAT repeat protein
MNKDQLIKALSEASSNEEREKIAVALSKLGSEIIPPLLDMVRNYKQEDDITWAGLLSSLYKLKKEAIPTLISFLDDPDTRVRVVIINSLSQINDKSVINLIITKLEDQNNNVRLAAIDALGNFADESAIKPLIDTLNNSGEFINSHVTEALVKIGNNVLEPLKTTFNDKSQADTVRSTALYTIGKLKDFNSFEIIKKALLDENEHLEIRTSAALALGKLADNRAIPILKNISQSNINPKILSSAEYALQQLGEQNNNKLKI